MKKSELSKPAVDDLSFKNVIRLGAEKGCIEVPERWFDYRDARNITSHAYDEKKAEKIYALLPAFARDARVLLDELTKLVSTV